MGENKGERAFGGFRLDPSNALLWRGEVGVPLPPKPFEVLCYLTARPGQLVTKDELLDAVWSHLEVSESSLSASVNALRIALGDDAKTPRFIETVNRRGYRFIAPVSAIARDGQIHQPCRKAARPQPIASPQPRWRVGRQAPLGVLQGALEEVKSGKRQMIFITGEAGIGKTTLIEMFAERNEGSGIGILSCGCLEHFGTDEALFPLIEALRDYCASEDGPSLVKAMRNLAPSVLAQIPHLLDQGDAAALQREVLGATRERMLRELCELIEFLSFERPWVIVAEDLHWSDYATIDFLSRFARRCHKACVLLLATYRSADAAAGRHPVEAAYQELNLHGYCRELALGTLSPQEIAQYLALRFPQSSFRQDFATLIFQRTGGNPLFVVSLVDDWAALPGGLDGAGHLSRAHEKGALPSGIPRGLREMVAHQIDRLSNEEQQLLEAASAAGSEFPAAAISDALGCHISEVEQICEVLARRGQILVCAGIAEWPDGTVAGRYAFKHALFQEAVYERLGPAQRIRLHQKIAGRFEGGFRGSTPETASVLALHFEKGRMFAKAVYYLGEAAENAAKLFGNYEAAGYLTRALNLVSHLPAAEQPDVRIRLLMQRGRVRRSAGDLQDALEDLRAVVTCAIETQKRETEVKALMDLSRFCLWIDRKQCLELASRAVEQSLGLGDDLLTVLARGNHSILKLYSQGWQEGDASHCRHAVKAMRAAKDPRVAARRCGITSMLELISSNYRACAEAAASCQEIARRNGDVYQYVVYNSFEACALLYLGAWRGMRARVQEALEITEKNANRHISCLPRLMMGWLRVEAMDFQGARLVCRNALDPEVEDNPVNFFLGRNLIAKASLGLSDLATSRAQFQAIEHRIEVDGIPMDRIFYPLFYHTRCEYFLALGDLGRAREEARLCYEAARLPPERTYFALAPRLLAKIAMAAGDLAEARCFLSEAVEAVDQGGLPLAAWRIYATAAELYASLGEAKESAAFWRRSESCRHLLAQAFDQEMPLHALRGAAPASGALTGTRH